MENLAQKKFATVNVAKVLRLGARAGGSAAVLTRRAAHPSGCVRYSLSVKKL